MATDLHKFILMLNGLITGVLVPSSNNGLWARASYCSSLVRMRCTRRARNSAHWAAGPPSLSADDNQFHSPLLTNRCPPYLTHLADTLGKQVQADDLLTDNASRIIGAFHSADTKLSKYCWRCPIIAFRGTDKSTFSISLGTPLVFVTHWFMTATTQSCARKEYSNR